MRIEPSSLRFAAPRGLSEKTARQEPSTLRPAMRDCGGRVPHLCVPCVRCGKKPFPVVGVFRGYEFGRRGAPPSEICGHQR